MDNPFICPNDKSQLSIEVNGYRCSSCGAVYPIIDGIPDFRAKDEYWCNVDRQTMRRLNRKAEELGDWLEAAKEVIPEYMGHFNTFDRADAQMLWPTNSDSVILDAGSMWGGLTIPAAHFHRQVYAVDKTLETLSFLSIRARQMHINNIVTAGASVDRLPFKDQFFDLAILNGVLEWVALDDEFILKRDFGKRKKKRKSYNIDPRQVQLNALREIYRVLKKDGYLFLAIENRFGYTYLRGDPDDHVNLKYLSLLPRWMANLITRWKLNSDYRTYLYSPPGLVRLIKEAGFKDVFLYGAFNHYIRADKLVPFPLIGRLKEKIIPRRGFKTRLFFNTLPSLWRKYFSPSIMALASREPAEGNAYTPRLINLLGKSGISQEELRDSMVIKREGRRDDLLPVNYSVMKNTATKSFLFCKIGRTREIGGILAKEFEAIRQAEGILSHSVYSDSIPRAIYYGCVDGFPLLVTSFINAYPIDFQPNDSLDSIEWKTFGPQIEEAMNFLIVFQTKGKKRTVDGSEYFLTRLELQKKKLSKLYSTAENEWMEIVKDIETLQDQLRELKSFELSLGPVHGDYSFFYNIKFSGNKIAVLDFEHFEPEGSPLFDLATFLSDPLLMSSDYRLENHSMESIFQRFDWKSRIASLLDVYSRKTALPKAWLSFLIPLAALDYKTGNYPLNRDQETFPLNKEMTFRQALKLRLILE